MTPPPDPEVLLQTAVDYERAKRQAKEIVDAERRPAHSALTALTIQELMNRPRPDYLIDSWMPHRSLIQVVGQPETLKSFLMCHAGLTIASDLPSFFGYPVLKHGSVLYIAAEGGGSFQYRIRGWCTEHRVDPLSIPFRVIPMPLDLRAPTYQAELAAIVREFKPILIVVDTLSRCAPGAEENSARDMGEVVSFCTQLQSLADATVVIVHHPAKADPSGGGRGSGTIHGAVDTELRTALAGDRWTDGTQPIVVTCAKQKDDLKPPPLLLTGCPVAVCDTKGRPMAFDSGRPITTLVLRPSTPADEQQGSSALDKAIVAFVREHPGSTKEEIRKALQKNKAVVGKAVDQLVATKVLAVEDGGKGRGKRFSTQATWWGNDAF